MTKRSETLDRIKQENLLEELAKLLSKETRNNLTDCIELTKKMLVYAFS